MFIWPSYVTHTCACIILHLAMQFDCYTIKSPPARQHLTLVAELQLPTKKAAHKEQNREDTSTFRRLSLSDLMILTLTLIGGHEIPSWGLQNWHKQTDRAKRQASYFHFVYFGSRAARKYFRKKRAFHPTTSQNYIRIKQQQNSAQLLLPAQIQI